MRVFREPAEKRRRDRVLGRFRTFDGQGVWGVTANRKADVKSGSS